MPTNQIQKSAIDRRANRSRGNRVALTIGAVFCASVAAVAPAGASSHMDAPLITLDPAANTTDVYAFISETSGIQYLTTAVAVFPFEQPGIGPNTFRFDDRVAYDIHVSLGSDVGLGKSDFTYRFRFTTTYASTGTILSYLGQVTPNATPSLTFPAKQNQRQSYTVTLINDSTGQATLLGSGIAPPNNQGMVTPFYNQSNNGDDPAQGGLTTPTTPPTGAITNSGLDAYTKSTIFTLANGYQVFAGQRDDGFYADVQSIFDLDFSFGGTTHTPTKPYDSQAGFNVHTIVLNIPLSQLGGAKTAGVYATTSREIFGLTQDVNFGPFQQVGRQGNPLFCEIFIAEVDKDRYNETQPTQDATLFAKYATDPVEVDRDLGLTPAIPGLLKEIFIPDLIKVDLTTGPAKLAGTPGFSRLSVFGGDTLKNSANATVFGGWPNGRRFGDDVANIGLIALGAGAPSATFNATRVDRNDAAYNQVFPYAATPHNGRNIAPPTPATFSVPPAPAP
jgi:hypothetical protein